MEDLKIEINKLDLIDKVLDTAKTVFNPSKEELEKYHRKEMWVDKVESGGLLVTATVNNIVVGFAICERKDENLHIWNVGVLPKYRRLDLWKKMHHEIEFFAKSSNFKRLTLNTYKEKFPNMYSFVSKHGYNEVKTEFDEMQNTTKSYFEKTL